MENLPSHLRPKLADLTTTPAFTFPKSPLIVDFNKIETEFDKVGVATGVGLRNLFVIYSKKHNQCLHDPMTDLVVNARTASLLTEAAKMFEGEVMTAHQAFLKMTKLG